MASLEAQIFRHRVLWSSRMYRKLALCDQCDLNIYQTLDSTKLQGRIGQLDGTQQCDDRIDGFDAIR